MDLKQLAALLAVADHGSFSAAARAIHTVQSNVSTHIARLERELGATLVDRSSGGLTEEGEAAVARARRVQAEIDALTSDVHALRDEVTGSVRFGVIGSIARWLVPTLLRRMQERHPAVDLVVVDATTTSLLPQLGDGTLDLAVVNLPITDASLDVDPLFTEDRILVVPDGHPLGRAESIHLRDLVGHPLVMEPRGTAFRDELEAAAGAAEVTLQTLAEVDGMTLVASLAFRGFGPAVLPATITIDEYATGWTSIPIADLRQRVVGLARRRSGRLAAASRAVRDIVVELVHEEGPDLVGVSQLST